MKFTKLQPKPGDGVLRCDHVDKLQFNFFSFGEDLPEVEAFNSVTQQRVKVRWIIVCDDCLSSGYEPIAMATTFDIWNSKEPVILEDGKTN